MPENVRSGVLLLAWLRSPTSAIFQKLGAHADWQPSPFRLWLAVGLVLLYLAVRFHFSGGGEKTFKTFGETFQDVLEKRTGRLIEAEGSRASPHAWWQPRMEDILASAEEGFAAQKKGEFPAGLERTLIVWLADTLGQRTPSATTASPRIGLTARCTTN